LYQIHVLILIIEIWDLTTNRNITFYSTRYKRNKRELRHQDLGVSNGILFYAQQLNIALPRHTILLITEQYIRFHPTHKNLGISEVILLRLESQ